MTANPITRKARANKQAKAGGPKLADMGDPDDVRDGEPAAQASALPPPIAAPIAAYQPFPTELLPANLRELVERGAEAFDVDHSFLALPALVACGGLVGNNRWIKLTSTWSEAPIIWALVVCDSSTNKTAPFRFVMTPIYNLAKANRRDPSAAPRKYHTSDVTIERSYVIFQANPRGGLMYARDEMSTWFTSFSRYRADGSSSCSAWLEFFSPLTMDVDRKNGDVSFHDACLSIGGTIQPRIAAGVFANPKLFEAGGPFRFCFAMPPLRKRTLSKVPMPAKSIKKWEEICQRLAALDGPHQLPLAKEAEAQWESYFAESADIEYDATPLMRAAYGKMRAFAARFALLHYLIGCERDDSASGPIPLASMAAGIGLAKWFTAESERVFRMREESPKQYDLRTLADRIDRRDGGKVSPRDFFHRERRRFATADLAKAALEDLVAAGFGNWAPFNRQSPIFVRCQVVPAETPPAPEACTSEESGLATGTGAGVQDLGGPGSGDATEPGETIRRLAERPAEHVKAINDFFCGADERPTVPFPGSAEPDWRSLAVASLTVPDYVTAALIRRGMRTVGDVADLVRLDRSPKVVRHALLDEFGLTGRRAELLLTAIVLAQAGDVERGRGKRQAN